MFREKLKSALVTGTDFIYRRPFGAALVVVMLIGFSVLSVNQYRYGWSDQAITVPFVKSIINPALYSHDFLLSQKPYYYTVWWQLVGEVIRYSHLNLELVFFIFYLLSIILSICALYKIALVLFSSRVVAYGAIFLAILSGPTLGSAYLFDDMLVTKVVALVPLLFAILLFLKNKYAWSYFLLGVGFLIHPLSAVYVIFPLVVASLTLFRTIKLGRLALCFMLLGLVASPILIWKFLYSPSYPGLIANPDWVVLLRARSPHHIFPSLWSIATLFKGFATVVLFFAAAKYKPANLEHHKTIRTMMCAILFLCFLGVIFTEFIPLSAVINVQLLRSFEFFVFITLLYFVNYLLIEFERGDLSNTLVAFIASFIFLLDTRDWAVAYVSLFVFVGIALWLVAAWWGERWLNDPRIKLAELFGVGVLAFALVLGIGLYVVQPPFSIHNAQAKNWLDLQVWAKNNTSLGAQFIVPPNTEGFRVESERAVYADWKDGTMMNFNPDFGLEWTRRMRVLGIDVAGNPIGLGFEGKSEYAYRAIASEITAITTRDVFLVRSNSASELRFPVVYTNSEYTIYAVSTTTNHQ